MSKDSQSRRRKEYFEDHWIPFGFTTNEISTYPELHYQEQQLSDVLEKKRSYGNRKLQRFRAKLKKRGFDSETIATMIKEYSHPSQSNIETRGEVLHSSVNVQDSFEMSKQVQQEIQKPAEKERDKRRREPRPVGIATSSSHITIVQPSAKRQRSTTIQDMTNLKDIDELTTDYMPKYLNVPDHMFKKMLADSLEGMENMIQTLDTPEKLQYTRIYAQLVNNIFYLKLEHDFWKNYYQVVIIEGKESLQMPKQMIQENNLRRIQFTTQDKIEMRQNRIIKQLQQAAEKLHNHKQSAVPHSLDINRLLTIIPAFVRKGQHKLTEDFQRKQLLLQLDVNEYRLVQKFYNLNPSKDQINSAKLIWQTTNAKGNAEEHVAILKQRIYSKRLPPSYNLLDHSIDTIRQLLSQQPLLDENKRTTILEERLKMIAKYKLDMITLTIRTAEELVRYHTNIITNEKKKLIDQIGGQEPLAELLNAILNAIAARQSNIIKRAQLLTKKKVSFFVDAPTVMENHILPSSPIIEVASSLSPKQLIFLANGPKYIPVCQSRFTHLPIDTIIEREYQNLVELVTIGLNDNCMSIKQPQSIEFLASLKNLLRQLLTKPLSNQLLTRARYDYQMVRSIRRVRNKDKIIIQKTDKSKVFHLGSAQSYREKSLEYMKKTNAYKEIESGINPCMVHLNQVLTLINPLLQKGSINLNLWKQSMYPDVKKVELAYLYTIPKPHKFGTPMRPIVSSMRAPATGVSHFLDQLLRPIYDRTARQTTFINDIHFVRRLELYRNIGRLSDTTTFITFDVTDLYTMIPRNGALLALEQFLCKHTRNGRIHTMTIDTIMKMARLVLDTNCFLFDSKYYQQIRGGAMGSPFTMTLANIYMLKWEQPLIEFQRAQNELYGRYIDDVFMTTNSMAQINVELNKMEKKDENIGITRSIGTTIEFLDVLVTNAEGQLKTCVFHKPAAEPYIVPFLSDHPRYIHRNTIRGALFRAVRLCSDVEDFDKERLNIEITLLLNGYPPKFILYHFKRFFEQMNAISLMEQLDSDIYRQLHEKLLQQLTNRERKQNKVDSDTNQLIQQEGWNKKEIRIHYTFENGPMLSFKSEFRRLWKNYFIYPGSPMNGVTLKIATRINKSLSQLLIKKKPPRSMLTSDNSINPK